MKILTIHFMFMWMIKAKCISGNQLSPILPEYKATYEQVMKGLIDGYLHHYLDITPGNTLGIAHASSILLNVTGKKE